MSRINDEDTKLTIATNVIRALKKQGKSRYWLAKETGEYEGTIANVCHGRNVCGAGMLSRIANALGVTTDKLLEKPKKTSRHA